MEPRTDRPKTDPGDPDICSCAIVLEAPRPWALPFDWPPDAGPPLVEVFVVTPNAAPTALTVVAPLWPDSGLLGLAHAALVLARCPRVLLLPARLPDPGALAALAGCPDDADVVLLRSPAPPAELLPARLHRRCLRPLERALARGAQTLPRGLRVVQVEPGL